jgi:hypothetical protein
MQKIYNLYRTDYLSNIITFLVKKDIDKLYFSEYDEYIVIEKFFLYLFQIYILL